MSKLVTDSKFLMDFLFTGTYPGDTALSDTIKGLKRAALDCTEIRATCDYMEPEEVRAKLDSVNVVLVETWHSMLALRDDFKDLIDAHFEKLT